jgi:hypothetical protein
LLDCRHVIFRDGIVGAVGNEILPRETGFIEALADDVLNCAVVRFDAASS